MQSILYVGGGADTVTSAAYDADWPLVPGDNLIKFMVTSPDGSANQDLQDPRQQGRLNRRDAGIPEPRRQHHEHPCCGHAVAAFNPVTTAYTATVGAAVTSVTLTGIQNHDGATISNDPGPDLMSGVATVGPWAGESVINIDLTAEDGATTKRYTVTAERILTVNFDSADYSVNEGGSVQVSVTLNGVPGNEVRADLSTTLQGATTPTSEACRNTSRLRVPMRVPIRSRPSISLRGPTSPVTPVRA